MFKVVAERRKRRVWSPRTVAASVAVHLLLLAGFVTAAANAGPAKPDVGFIELGPVPPEPPKIARVDPPPPAPRQDEPPAVPGRTLELQAPPTVPPDLPPPDLNAIPAMPDQYSGQGPIGNVIGPPKPGVTTGPVPPHGQGDDALPRWDTPIEVEKADTRPELSNQRQAQQLLERNYPPLLRDAGATGHTTVQLIIDTEGKVEPGSVRVQDSTHEAFNEAAIRAVERFRFKPATLHGHPVAVLVTLPIEWQIAQ